MKVNVTTRKKLVEVGLMIREARERAEITQATLAAKIGMARENLIRVEKGRANLTVETLIRIADGLGLIVSIGYSAASTKTSSSTKRGTKPVGRSARSRRASSKQPSQKK